MSRHHTTAPRDTAASERQEDAGTDAPFLREGKAPSEHK